MDENGRHRSPAEDAPWAPPRLRMLVLLAITVAGLWLCVRMALPFLPALAWSLALAVLFVPLQRRLEHRLAPSVAALTTVLTVALIVVVPATLIGQRLVGEATQGAQLLSAKVESGEWERAFQASPRLQAMAERVGRGLDLPAAARASAQWLSTTAGALLKGSVLQLIGVVMTFYLLFFLLRDRERALRALHAVSPLPEARTAHLVHRVADTIHATVYGTLAVASLQGLLGGLMFWWLGLPAPMLWGVVMAVLAVVPVLGAFVVWIPAALFLVADGHWVSGLVLAGWGLLVVGTVDNLLRPVLVGSRLRQHTVLAFLSLVGGLLVFGSAGLILGPVVLTVTLELLEAWREANDPKWELTQK